MQNEIKDLKKKVLALEGKCATLEREMESLREQNQKQRRKIKSLKKNKKDSLLLLAESHNDKAPNAGADILSKSNNEEGGGIFDGMSFTLEFTAGIPFKERQEVTSLVTDNGGSVSYTVNSQVYFDFAFRLSMFLHWCVVLLSCAFVWRCSANPFYLIDKLLGS